jgi:hypothetical protein
MVNHFYLLLFALGLTFPSFSQIVTIGSGTTTTNQVPVYGYYNYSYTQQIYLASDFGSSAGSPKMINKISFYYVSGDFAPSSNWDLYMGSTSQNDFQTTNTWVSPSSLQRVFSGSLPAPAEDSWLEITLDTPFLWNGTSNVVLAIDENQNDYAEITWRNYAAGANRSMVYYEDDNDVSAQHPPTANGRYGYIPQTQFNAIAVSACTGTPDHYGAIAVNGKDTICAGESTMIDLDDSDFTLGMDGLTVLWQFSTDNGNNWNDIPSYPAKSFKTGKLAVTTEYRAIVTCTNSSLSDITESVRIKVNPLPNVTIEPGSYALCNNDAAELIANGAISYSWSPAAGLSSTTSDIVMANPDNTTAYAVKGTSAAGCSNTAVTVVYKSGEVIPQATYSPVQHCVPGAPVTILINATRLPEGLSNGGHWEYRFLGANGTTVAQNWSTNPSFTFSPTADSLFNYFYQVRNSACSGDVSDSLRISIPIGFGADVAITNYDCNTLKGTFSMENAYGQKDPVNVFVNNLNDASNLENITLAGNSSVLDGRVQMTSNMPGQTGSLLLSMPFMEAGFNNSMKVAFKLTADMPYEVYGTGGGDGIAYSFGDDALMSGDGPAQNGKGSKLRLSFDAAENDNGNVPGVYLVYGYEDYAEYGPETDGVLAYSSNVAAWKGRSDVPVILTISELGEATVTIDGVAIFANVQLPDAYKHADISNWKHLFSATTGGDALRQAVSELRITAGQLLFAITPESVTTPPSQWQTSGVFTDLSPGLYNLWISQTGSGTCMKSIGVYEIKNLNPIVNIGHDTTICAGETLTLNAGNEGSTYVWSGSTSVGQEIEVSEEGSYIVYVTDSSGCVGIGAIGVEVSDAPAATGISVQGIYPTMYFGVANSENADLYSWDFGDGHLLAGGPSMVAHAFSATGTYNISVTMSNFAGCGTTTLTQSVNVSTVAGIEEQQIAGLKVYPNPTSDVVYISLEDNQSGTVTVYNVSGSVVAATAAFQSTSNIDVKSWEKGIYFLNIQSAGATSVQKIIVQ